MEKNEINDPLYELKDQMFVLKNKLKREIIINEEQTKVVVNEYKPRTLYIWPVLGALLGIGSAAGLIYNLVTKFDEMPKWLIFFYFFLIAIAIISNTYIHGHRRSTTYNIKEGNLYVSNIFTKWVHDGVTIPISSIRFIEFMAKPIQNSRVRVVYNKYDDLYLVSKDVERIISDILRVNPDIEIRHEKKL